MNINLIRWDLRFKTAFTFLVILLTAMIAWSADGAPASGPATATAVSIWTILTPVLVPVVIALLKIGLMYWGAKIPKALIPVIAPILGAGIDYITSGTLGAGTAWGAALGLSGVGLREIVDQLRNLGSAPTT
jgi:hypothetical protein